MKVSWIHIYEKQVLGERERALISYNYSCFSHFHTPVDYFFSSTFEEIKRDLLPYLKMSHTIP